MLYSYENRIKVGGRSSEFGEFPERQKNIVGEGFPLPFKRVVIFLQTIVTKVM